MPEVRARLCSFIVSLGDQGVLTLQPLLGTHETSVFHLWVLLQPPGSMQVSVG